MPTCLQDSSPLTSGRSDRAASQGPRPGRPGQRQAGPSRWEPGLPACLNPPAGDGVYCAGAIGEVCASRAHATAQQAGALGSAAPPPLARPAAPLLPSPPRPPAEASVRGVPGSCRGLVQLHQSLFYSSALCATLLFRQPLVGKESRGRPVCTTSEAARARINGREPREIALPSKVDRWYSKRGSAQNDMQPARGPPHALAATQARGTQRQVRHSTD